jgi:hypothetical protein
MWLKKTKLSAPADSLRPAYRRQAWRLFSLPRRITGRQNFFFILAKALRGGQDAEPQRNCSLIGLTFRRLGLPLRLSGFARRLFAVLNSYVKQLA